MDVVCGRCRAEYEFDDALISERGTTVRCTSCGLQFKVFPIAGQRAPEIWRVFDPVDRRAPPVSYQSLGGLQRAIAEGEVGARHLLSRGSEAPRALSEIVELEPLLRQPVSEPPPPLSPQADGVGRTRAASGTVLGIEARPDPRQHLIGGSAESTLEEADEEIVPGSDEPPEVAKPSTGAVSSTSHEEVVPSHSHEPLDPSLGTPEIPAPAPLPAEVARPVIRSVLSIAPGAGSVRPPEPSPQTESTAGRTPSIAAPRASLRSTMASTAPRVRRDVSVPPSEQPHPSESVSASEPLDPVKQPAVSAIASAESSVVPPSDPLISDSGEYPGQMTPTPSAIRAYESVDSEPVSAIPGRPQRRGAHSGGIVIAVLAGGLIFLGFANRGRVVDLLGGGDSSSDQASVSSSISSELLKTLDDAEVEWLARRFLREADKTAQGKYAPHGAQLTSLQQAGFSKSWAAVNASRRAGELAQARALAVGLNKGIEEAYALALLDLTDTSGEPPWPLVIRRLKSASSGERGSFLARSMYIFALAQSGNLDKAVADFENLRQLTGATKARLFVELEAFLGRRQGSNSAPEDDSSTEEEAADSEVGDDAAPEEESSDSQLEDEGETATPSESVVEEQAPTETPVETQVVEPEPPKQKKKLPPGTKEKVAQADAMWRGGNREGSLVIYREIVATIGTKHFLGQRSAARIRQAEREKAESQ